MQHLISNFDMYKIIRDAYINAFPRSIPDEIFNDDMYISLISNYLVKEKRFDEITKTDVGYELNGKQTDLYKNQNELPKYSIAYYINRLSNKEELNKYLKDTTVVLKEFRQWLISEKYIASGRLTEKFIKQEKWFDI